MGSSVRYECAACGFSDDCWLGVGMGYPTVTRETYREISQGLYGAHWQQLFTAHPHAGVLAKDSLFVCERCGHWGTFLDITLYEPDDYHAVLQDREQRRDIGKDGRPHFFISQMLKNGWHVVEEYHPACPHCGGSMRSLGNSERRLVGLTLRCPSCGTVNQLQQGHIMWD